MKNVLLVGSNGMLGQSLFLKLVDNVNFNLFCISLEDSSCYNYKNYHKIDLSSELQIKDYLNKMNFDLIVNVAAYTAVDKAEIEKDLCKAINVEAVKILADYSKKNNSHFIHISSDYIFDGNNGPYSEIDKKNPLGYYGWSKLEGENVIINSDCNFSIIRTNVLYGNSKYGRPDFVKWVINSLEKNSEIKIVTDQYNNPTYIEDLSDAILNINANEKFGIYNIGGEKVLNRYEFTLKIAEYFNLSKNLIIPIITKDLNQLASRPLKSGLIIDKAKKELNYQATSIEKTFELMKNMNF